MTYTTPRYVEAMASSAPPAPPDPDRVDFALDELPGEALHTVLHAYRARGPAVPTRFLGIPSFVIAGREALYDAMMDTERFPPHRMYQASFEGAIGESFISMAEPERHRVYRKLATPAFRSRAVERHVRGGLAPLAHELLDELEGRDRFDLIADYAARFPYLVITRLLGLPREREAAFHTWALALLRFRDDPGAAKQAAEELTGLLAPIVEQRRKQPQDDVISGLVTARVEGRALSDEEIFSHVRLLFPTGGETTHGSLANTLSILLQDPALWQKLGEDPGLIEGVVDEALRLETPIAVLPRMSASREIEFHGCTIPADSWVLFAIAGANRDPACFEAPDRFDPKRDQRDTLTFGRGVKACPGMHLAKSNLAAAISVLRERMPRLELLDREAARPRRTVLRCPDALHVRRLA